MKKQMQKPTKIIFSIGLLSALALFYQNCAKGFESENLAQLSSNTGGNLFNSDAKGNPFVCSSVGLQSKAPFARLTQAQYSNTLLSALGTALHDQIKSAIPTLYSDLLTKNVRDFQKQIDETQMGAYQSIAEKAYLAIQASSALASQLGSACVNFATVTADCKTNFVKALGKKMFRRPLTEVETNKYVLQVFDKGDNGIEGVGLTVYAMMMAPDFLLRLELGNPDDMTNTTSYNISPYEVASRLSYYLWDAPPDAPLMMAADQNELSTSPQISAQVDRMMADPRARNKIKDFFRYWLDPKRYSAASFSADFLGGFDVTAANTEFEREMYEYIDYVVFQKNGTFADLLAGTESFARTNATAQVYGHAALTDTTPAQMSSGRKGLLLRAPVIATEGNETHPILRGVKFRSRFLCDPLGLPSGVMTSDPTFFSDEARLTSSTRARTAGITSSASCMGCHASINPLGFSMEGFDGLGRQRTIEKSYSTLGKQLAEFPVDSRVSDLYIETGTSYSVNDATEVIDHMLAGNKAPACFVQQIYRYYQVKSESPQDGCQLASMYDKIKAQDYNGKPILTVFKELLVYPAIFKRSL